jgi:FkbM family methyltransferase
MSIKSELKKLAEKITDTRIYRVRELPRGIDFIQDIANAMPMYRVQIVFDVGANVGQSTHIYLARFPESGIYCFEPVDDTFRRLQDNMKGNARVYCHRLALGSSNRKGEMALQGKSDMYFLLDQSKAPLMNNDVKTESVNIVTLDEFCSANGIDRINYLKIDTEGGDLEILKGSVNMLSEQKIDFVEVEAGMNPGNDRHVPFESLKGFLESHEYFIFGIYEQINEWPTRKPHLRRTNPLFISRRIIEMDWNSAEALA